MFRKKGAASFFIVAFFVLGMIQPALAIGVPAPTIIEALLIEQAETYKIVVRGLTVANSEVLIYVDGNYVGTAESATKGTGTDSFFLSINHGFTPGIRNVSAVARDKTSLVLSPMSAPIALALPALPAPTMVAPNERTVTAKVKPMITGLTRSGTKVHIYIDGKLNGSTDFLFHPSGTANFAYKPFLNLSVGQHSAWAVAEDRNGRKSILSNTLNFRIEENYPAPWLVKPVVNIQSSIERPFIAGLAKNDSLIKIFVNHRLVGQFQIKNHPSGTANFAYLLPRALPAGRHLFYATATDSRGKESLWSNLVFYTVPFSQITPEAVEEKPVVKGEDGPIVDLKLRSFIEQARNFDRGAKVDLNDEELTELGNYIRRFEDLNVPQEERSLLRNMYNALRAGRDNDLPTLEELLRHAGDGTASPTPGGLLDESRERQSRLKWNLVIFLVFLVAVIAWIFWVNRELIKEKREQEQTNDKK